MKAGIYTIPAADYHADPAATPSLSKSIAHTLLTASPAHARVAHPRLNPNFQRDAEDKFDLGNACHSLFLEGVDNVHIVHADNWTTKAAKEERDMARQHGRTPMLAKDRRRVDEMLEALAAQLDQLDIQPELFTAGKPEQTLIWQEDGVWCRALVDWLHDDHQAIDDLKTTKASANPDSWDRTAYGMGADLQARWYQRGVKALTGVEPEFRFVVVEVEPPYAISVVSLSPHAVSLADQKLDYAVNVWRRCLELDRWDGYTPRVAYIAPPVYEETKWLEREAREEAAA